MTTPEMKFSERCQNGSVELHWHVWFHWSYSTFIMMYLKWESDFDQMSQNSKRNHEFRISQTRRFEIVFQSQLKWKEYSVSTTRILLAKNKKSSSSITIGWAAVLWEGPNDCASQEFWLSEFGHSSQPHFPTYDTSTVLPHLGILGYLNLKLFCCPVIDYSGAGICWNYLNTESIQNPRETGFPQLLFPACCILHPR